MSTAGTSGDGHVSQGWTACATRGRIVLLAAAGALLTLGATVPVWVTARLVDAAGTTSLPAAGAESSGIVMPVALAAAAGAFALTLVDGWLRRVVAAVVVACGIGIVLGCAAVLVDPMAAVAAPGVVPVSAVTGVAPWLALLGGLLVSAGGLLAFVTGGRWTPRPARRADGTAGRRPSREAPVLSDWDALSEGDDPT
ncbi:Trp biosynthesis-associated membrane protein [Mobilicoccus pelagius]|uniref:Uncharacterized protein n=1 Tax=Mobilicoccus pelagius NBRC 104925 TaxID=1089455 RepID=H5UQ68_9MICO|nr:Trp biosynthesis-associated membrane protein [Mobilicoccus pelagius]GAB47873.1 hypothetical protein MOPEL_029_01560 [Mobilicoccus pelagius NBRC 104925]